MPAPDPDPQPALPWHAAVVWALTGVRVEGLPLGVRPDVARIVAWFRPEQVAQARACADVRREAGLPWPIPSPADLTVPAAQLSATIWAVRTQLGLVGPTAVATGSRPLTADERRLLTDVPPHHG